MHPNEIKAFARLTNLDTTCAGKIVLIQRDDGQYLTRDDHGRSTWTNDKEQARPMDYTRDRVHQQLFQVEIEYGAKWTAIPVADAE